MYDLTNQGRGLELPAAPPYVMPAILPPIGCYGRPGAEKPASPVVDHHTVRPVSTPGIAPPDSSWAQGPLRPDATPPRAGGCDEAPRGRDIPPDAAARSGVIALGATAEQTPGSTGGARTAAATPPASHNDAQARNQSPLAPDAAPDASRPKDRPAGTTTDMPSCPKDGHHQRPHEAPPSASSGSDMPETGATANNERPHDTTTPPDINATELRPPADVALFDAARQGLRKVPESADVGPVSRGLVNAGAEIIAAYAEQNRADMILAGNNELRRGEKPPGGPVAKGDLPPAGFKLPPANEIADGLSLIHTPVAALVAAARYLEHHQSDTNVVDKVADTVSRRLAGAPRVSDGITDVAKAASGYTREQYGQTRTAAGSATLVPMLWHAAALEAVKADADPRTIAALARAFRDSMVRNAKHEPTYPPSLRSLSQQITTQRLEAEKWRLQHGTFGPVRIERAGQPNLREPNVKALAVEDYLVTRAVEHCAATFVDYETQQKQQKEHKAAVEAEEKTFRQQTRVAYSDLTIGGQANAIASSLFEALDDPNIDPNQLVVADSLAALQELAGIGIGPSPNDLRTLHEELKLPLVVGLYRHLPRIRAGLGTPGEVLYICTLNTEGLSETTPHPTDPKETLNTTGMRRELRLAVVAAAQSHSPERITLPFGDQANRLFATYRNNTLRWNYFLDITTPGSLDQPLSDAQHARQAALLRARAMMLLQSANQTRKANNRAQFTSPLARRLNGINSWMQRFNAGQITALTGYDALMQTINSTRPKPPAQPKGSSPNVV